TGERYWQARLGNGFSGSLVTANGLSYWTANNGETKVIRPGQELDLVATNPLGENCYSSPAISDDLVFIRGEFHLFCIGMSSSK
ncbi:MAG: serine/threonine protein kinase, partial [Planctomycetales bacterium]|nr:serine/threonine protein kinase [Planctomycetales bacterium]